jgi:alkaline phosphatase
MKRIFNLLCLVLIAIAVNGQAKYVFYFIGDGMGVNQVNGTETYYAAIEGKNARQPLQITQFPAAGMVYTLSGSNPVTDSAAGGTALATGVKTYNSAIGVDIDKNRIESVAVWAKKAGKKVGIATSVSVDHATPAAFYAHQPNRRMYYEIATDLPKADFDFHAGSGFLKPNTTFDKQEAPSIYPILDEAGYTIAKGVKEYKEKAKSAKKMILIQEDGKDVYSLPYAIDRQEGDLTLSQITESAIDFLTKDNSKGFFLMVEGGKIDWACHSNDPGTAFRELKDMDDAVKVAYAFYKKHPKETLIVITADHETGGITLGNNHYQMNTKVLQYQNSSVDKLSAKLDELRKAKDNKVTWEDMKEFLGEQYGFWKNIEMSWENEKELRDAFEASFVNNNVKYEETLYSNNQSMATTAQKVMNRIAMVNWAHGSHTAGYVPVYAVGVGSEQFNGVMDNTEIPKKIAKAAKY